MRFSGKKNKIISDAATYVSLQFYQRLEGTMCLNVCGTKPYGWLFYTFTVDFK
jgi:hypothetical protein